MFGYKVRTLPSLCRTSPASSALRFILIQRLWDSVYRRSLQIFVPFIFTSFCVCIGSLFCYHFCLISSARLCFLKTEKCPVSPRYLLHDEDKFSFEMQEAAGGLTETSVVAPAVLAAACTQLYYSIRHYCIATCFDIY